MSNEHEFSLVNANRSEISACSNLFFCFPLLGSQTMPDEKDHNSNNKDLDQSH